MKASRYNRLFQAPNGAWLAFNSWSTALAEIEPENLEFFRALLADPDAVVCDTAEKRQMRESMLEAHFLIDDRMEELATLKADLLRDRFGADELYLTIAPTLECNFRCDYCYEDHLKVTMSKPVEAALLQWVEQRMDKSKELMVTWYGGEPLLPRAFAVMERLSDAFLQLTSQSGKKYAAHLITNGYLLDRAKMKRMAELGVVKVQVTVDGPPDIHDERRPLVGGKGTFRRIVDNLKETADLAEFQLRINIDRRNAMSAIDVAEILRKEGLIKQVRPYLAQVMAAGATCGNIFELCYSDEEYAKTELELYREAARRGLPISRYPSRLAGAYCSADRINAYVVSPSGLLFKCWHEVTLNPDMAIGSLLDDQEPFQKLNEDHWLKWDSFEKSGCRSCEVLPLCHGGCPLQAMKDPDRDRGACDHYKYHLQPLLEIHYLRETGALGPQQEAAAEGGSS